MLKNISLAWTNFVEICYRKCCTRCYFTIKGLGAPVSTSQCLRLEATTREKKERKIEQKKRETYLAVWVFILHFIQTWVYNVYNSVKQSYFLVPWVPGDFHSMHRGKWVAGWLQKQRVREVRKGTWHPLCPVSETVQGKPLAPMVAFKWKAVEVFYNWEWNRPTGWLNDNYSH